MPSNKAFPDLRLLAELPRSVFRGPDSPRDSKDEASRLSFLRMLRRRSAGTTREAHSRIRTEQQFNAAVWLRFRKPFSGSLALILVYRDHKGVHRVQVDEGTISADITLMLSGLVTIPVHGELEYMAAYCQGLPQEQDVIVDELYVQREHRAGDMKQGLRRA